MRSGHAAGGVGAREEQPRITNGWTGWLDPVAHRATRWGRAVSGGASLPTEGANLSPDSREGARYPQAGRHGAPSRYTAHACRGVADGPQARARADLRDRLLPCELWVSASSKS